MDPSVLCSLVEFLNKRLEELKPQFIKRIHLSSLTFGSIPFDITEVRVVKEGADEFVLDCGIKCAPILSFLSDLQMYRWHGNAHVAIMIELRGGGVLQPKFQRFNFYGHARLAFTPLVPYFPGFGAMTICLHSTPVVTTPSLSKRKDICRLTLSWMSISPCCRLSESKWVNSCLTSSPITSSAVFLFGQQESLYVCLCLHWRHSPVCRFPFCQRECAES